MSATTETTFADLRQYVLERVDREDVLFLGIFEKVTGVHIGNIKYEPVDSELRYAVMGIMVGQTEWRGKGVAAEVIEASARWLQSSRGIEEIVLGVARSHEAAIRAYEATGFKVESTNRIAVDLQTNLTMVLRTRSLAPAGSSSRASPFTSDTDFDA